MLGFIGSGFIKSLKDFQVICRNCYRSFENAEKILNLREKKKQLVKGRALSQEKYELRRTKKNISLKLNITETALPDLEEYQEKSEQVVVHRQH